MLLMDEMIDGGKILELDTNLLTQRVLMREGDASYNENDSNGRSSAGSGGQSINLADLTIGQALKQAREQLIANMGAPSS